MHIWGAYSTPPHPRLLSIGTPSRLLEGYICDFLSWLRMAWGWLSLR